MVVMFLPTILNIALKLGWKMNTMQGNGCNSIITIHKRPRSFSVAKHDKAKESAKN